MGLDVRVEINRPNEVDTFTNGDTISGVVKLSITKSLALTSIQVKLEGLSSTSFPVPDKRKKDNKESMRSDLHKFLYDSLIVFPPSNVRSVSNSKEFTLTPGSYTYNFSFKIPHNSSCRELEGISNKVVYNRNTFDVVVNNGTLMSNTQSYIQNLSGSNSGNTPQLTEQSYHEIHQLPPSFKQESMASIKYFIKVTCNRPSLFKINLRDTNPFSFMPLDFDARGSPFAETLEKSEFREVFFRRNVSLRKSFASNDKTLPATPKKKGLFGSILGNVPSRSGMKGFSPNTTTEDLHFAFEMRLRDPPHLSPVSGANIRLYFVTNDSPSKYLSSNEKGSTSNGKGVIYLQRLIFELQATTYMSVIDRSSTKPNVHQAKTDENMLLYDNTFHNIPLDLSNAKPQTFASATSSQYIGERSYEIELPRKYFSDWVLPNAIPPNFRTCNIQRSYTLRVIAGLSSETIDDPSNPKETAAKVNMVDVVCPDIRILGGARAHDAPAYGANNTSDSGPETKQDSSYPPEKQSYNTPSAHGPSEGPSVGPSSALPSYDDAIKHR